MASTAADAAQSLPHLDQGEAKQAVEHGKQGHANVLATHAKKSLNYPERTGKYSHLQEAIMHLKEAIEQGKAGYADATTEHAETAQTRLTEVKF